MNATGTDLFQGTSLISSHPHDLSARDFGERLVAFLPNLRRFAISLTGSRDIADDLVQATCERALASRDSFDPDSRLDAWLFRILRNLWIDLNRRKKTAGPRDDIDDHADIVGTRGEPEAMARLELTSVSEALGTLPPEQRDVLVLVCVEDYSYKEAAELLGIPIGTVMSRLARARKQLAEKVGISPEPVRSSRDKESSDERNGI